jgi:hypothetical protein
MAKTYFRLFILLSLIVTAIGVYISISRQTVKYPVNPEYPVEYHDVKGWHIAVSGLIMLLIGLLLKKASSNKNVMNSTENINNIE